MMLYIVGNLTNIHTKPLRLALFYSLVSVLLSSALAQLPKTLNQRISPRLPST